MRDGVIRGSRSGYARATSGLERMALSLLIVRDPLESSFCGCSMRTGPKPNSPATAPAAWPHTWRTPKVVARWTLGTHGGARHCRVLREQGSTYEIESGMGIPRVMPRTLRMEVAHGETAEVVGAMVNVGNPHFVVRVETDDFSAHGLSWQELGARIAVDPRFPHGTNVEFVHVLAPDRIAFRIFERGCGPTTSSGTGTCASAAMTMALHGVNRKLVALAEGGPQEVAWPSNADELRLTGPAELLCQGFAFDAEAALDSREGLDL